MALPLIGAIGNVLGAFDKDRFKTEYHYGTQELNQQNKALKEQIGQLEMLKKQGKLNLSSVNTPLQKQTQIQNETMNTNFLKGTGAKVIGGVIALVIIVFAFRKMGKSNKKLA